MSAFETPEDGYAADETVRRLISDALAGNIPHPDAGYEPPRAYAFEIPPSVEPVLERLGFVHAANRYGDHHPIPMLLRLHAQGYSLGDVATTLAVMARTGMRLWLAEPGRDLTDPWGRERVRTVQGYLDRLGPAEGRHDADLAEYLLDLGYNWFTFDRNPLNDTPGASDVVLLLEAAALGGHLGHLARFMAEVQDVEPYGLVGVHEGWGRLAYRGRDLYELWPERPPESDAVYELRDLHTGEPWIRFEQAGRAGRSFLLKVVTLG